MNREGRSPLEVGMDSSERNETNSDYTLEIEAKQQEVEQQFEEVLEEIEASEVPEETKQRLIEKLVKAGQKVSRALTLVGMFSLSIGVGVTANKPAYLLGSIAREQLITDVSTREVKGKKVYSHSDETTTHILNAVAGKEKLRLEEYEELIRIDFKKAITARIEYAKVYLGKSIVKQYQEQYARVESMDIEELGVAYRQFNGHGRIELEKMSGREYLEYCINPNPNIRSDDQETLNEELYQALWQLEAECGEPKIRLVSNPKEFDSHSSRNHYDPKTNTVYIVWPYTDSFRRGEKGLIAEFSHSKQFSDKPMQSIFQRIRDIKMVDEEVEKTGSSWRAAYDKLLYDLPGSHEHEAHSEIEPKLEEQLESLLPKRAMLFAESIVGDEQSILKYYLGSYPKKEQEILTNNLQAFRRKMEALTKVFEKNYQEASDPSSKTILIQKLRDDVFSLLEEYKQNKFKITKDPADLASG